MSEEFAQHALEVINDLCEKFPVKEEVWESVKAFASGSNARFSEHGSYCNNEILKILREYISEHPERKFYNKPTKTFNGIEFGLWLDPTKKSIGRNRLFKWLREKGYFVNGNNPSAEMIAKGWMLQVVGQRINLKTPLFTPEGVEHLAPIIAKDYYFLTSDL